jgi:uncharacterized short protein YbdD (DUF466 family)
MRLHALIIKLSLCCLLVCSSFLYAAESIQNEWDDVEKLVIIGDIHGDYDSYISVLREAGVINRRGNWIGDDTHLVQVGDVPDRGPDTLKIIEHLQKLETQAKRNDGMVHVLIGNHEYMNVVSDLRYVHPGEYKAMTSRNSSRFRDAYYQQVVASLLNLEEPPVIDDAFKDKWYEDIPLGYVEHRLTWQPGGDINNWVSTHNSVIRINDMLFMHAGLGPIMLTMSLDDLNNQIRAEMLGALQPENNLGDNEDGPLWYRGLAMNSETTESAHVEALLSTYGVKHVIVGHTPELGVITPRFGGKVIITDTGMSAYYGTHKASMLVENGEAFALQDGEKIALPITDDEIIPYFQTLVELKPDHQPLLNHIQKLLNPEPIQKELESAVEDNGINQ